MIYKDYGSTGKKVSAIGFGGMRFLAEEYSDGNLKPCADLVLEAFEKGITYFDTAPGYCGDKSELIFGEAFKQMKYGDFYVSTKCGLWNADTADGARRMIEQSLERMNVPKITFYNMWCIKTLDEYKKMTAKGGIYEGILRAQEEGLIEHICATTHASAEDMVTIINDGKIEGITLGYNAINFAYRRAGIAHAFSKNKAVIVMNPLGGGTIPRHPERFAFLNEGTDDSVVVAALKFLLAHEEITVTLPGIGSSAHLNEALLALNNIPKVDAAYLDALSKRLSNELNTLCTSCEYCESCPVDIPITKFMDAYNDVLLSNGGNISSAYSKLKFFWGVAHDIAAKCIDCGACESLCTQKLPIMQRLKEIAAFEPPPQA